MPAPLHESDSNRGHPERVQVSEGGTHTDAEYTCPMHPELRQDRPGSCPSCGMTLERATSPVTPTRTEWTCPMHPEIVRDVPGTCPLCGMALERRSVSVPDDEEDPELRDMTRRFWAAALFTVPVVVLAMGDLLPGRPISTPSPP